MVSVHLISLLAFLYCFTPLQIHWCALCPYKVSAPLGLRPSYWHSLSLWITLAQVLAHHLPLTIPAPGIPSIESTLLKLLLPQNIYTTPVLYSTTLLYFLQCIYHSLELIYIIHLFTICPPTRMKAPWEQGFLQSYPQLCPQNKGAPGMPELSVYSQYAVTQSMSKQENIKALEN